MLYKICWCELGFISQINMFISNSNPIYPPYPMCRHLFLKSTTNYKFIISFFFSKKMSLQECDSSWLHSDSLGAISLGKKKKKKQIPQISALLPCWVFVYVWCESLWTTDPNNLAAAGCQEMWKGGNGAMPKNSMQAGILSFHSGIPQFSFSLRWRSHLQCFSHLHLIWPDFMHYKSHWEKIHNLSLCFEDKKEDKRRWSSLCCYLFIAIVG